MAAQRPQCERVLILDDEPDTLDSMKQVLLLGGVSEVQCAASIAEAEGILASGFRPSAVVLDFVLEHERGETFASRLRTDPGYRDVPIVAVSGDQAALRRARHTVDRTLRKPADPDDLLRVLREVCKPP
jgi:CheY-like chemotaxis protein